MDETTTMLLAQLSEQEQDAAKLLRSAQARRKQILLDQQETEALEAELSRKEYYNSLKQVPTELKTLGISYRQLHTMASKHNTLRVLRVHRDIERLLAAALPSEGEEAFYRLVSELVVLLVGAYASNKSIMSALRADAATAPYFGVQTDAVSIPIAAVGKSASLSNELLDSLVTAYALSWGQATNYE